MAALVLVGLVVSGPLAEEIGARAASSVEEALAADRLVISAVRIAKVLNVSQIVIGAVIVGFGTSVPEFVVSGLAAGQGNVGLAMSNVVASNAANVAPSIASGS